MLKELEYFIKYSIEDKRPEFASVLREEPRINYPWEAIRELAMNAVMHRAYNGNNSPIKFYEYNDRIEINNPGNLYGKVNQENFPNETDYRNPNIAEIMLNLGYVNRFGSGVNTVSSLLKENGNAPAEFLFGDYTTFKVIVRNADVTENRTNDGTTGTNNGTNNGTDGTERNNSGTIAEQSGTIGETIRNNEESDSDISELVLEQIQKNKRISVKQLSKIFNKTRASMFRIIEKLKTDGKLRRVGPLKSGTWEVIE